MQIRKNKNKRPTIYKCLCYETNNGYWKCSICDMIFKTPKYHCQHYHNDIMNEISSNGSPTKDYIIELIKLKRNETNSKHHQLLKHSDDYQMECTKHHQQFTFDQLPPPVSKYKIDDSIDLPPPTHPIQSINNQPNQDDISLINTKYLNSLLSCNNTEIDQHIHITTTETFINTQQHLVEDTNEYCTTLISNDDKQRLNQFTQHTKCLIATTLCDNNVSFHKANVFVEIAIELMKYIQQLELDLNDAIDVLSGKLTKFKDTAASSRARLIGEMIKKDTYERCLKSEYLGIQLDETTDVTGYSQMVIKARLLNNDLFCKENTSEDMFIGLFTNESYEMDAHSLMFNLFNNLQYGEQNLLYNVRAITTDNGTNVVKMKELIKNLFLKNGVIVLQASCLLHDQNLLVKTVDCLSCMEVVTWLLSHVNSSFKKINNMRNLLARNNSSYSILLTYAITRWLSRSNSVDRVLECIDVIEQFLKEETAELNELDKETFTIDRIKSIDKHVASIFEGKGSNNDRDIMTNELKDELLQLLEEMKEEEPNEDIIDLEQLDEHDDDQEKLKSMEEDLDNNLRKKVDQKRKAGLVDFIRLLFQSPTFMRRLCFVADVLRFHKELSLRCQQHELKMTDAFDTIIYHENSIRNMINQLNTNQLSDERFPMLITAMKNSRMPMLYDDERILFVSVLQDILNKIPEYFSNQYSLFSISQLLETGEYTEDSLNSLCDYIICNTKTEEEKKAENERKIEKWRKKKENYDKKMKEREERMKKKKEKEKKSKGPVTETIVNVQSKKQQPPRYPAQIEIDEKKITIEKELNEQIRKSFSLTQDRAAVDLSNKENLKSIMKKELELLNNSTDVKKKEFIRNHKSSFFVLHQLLISLDIMFPTTVQCESAFSVMKYVKTDQRNRLKEDTLDAIMHIKYCNKERKEIFIKEAASLWYSRKGSD